MRVVVISNDVVPAQGGKTGAGGLRAHGLAAGLAAHGIDVTTFVVADAVARHTREIGPLAAAEHVEVVPAGALSKRLSAMRPVVAVVVNADQAEHLHGTRRMRIVYDGFVPRMLELAFRSGPYPERALTRMAQLEGKAMRFADAVIVSVAGAMPYHLASLLHAGRDPRAVPMRVVEMAVPALPAANRPVGDLPVAVFTMSHPNWGPPGRWVEVASAHAGSAVRAIVVEDGSWGADRAEVESLRWRAFLEHPDVEVRSPQTWEELGGTFAEADLAIDLFSRTPVREVAPAPRSVIALAHGVAVVHPPFTGMAASIGAERAGWLVDPDDDDALEAFFTGLTSAEVAAHREGACRLAASRLDPAVAVQPLVDLIAEW